MQRTIDAIRPDATRFFGIDHGHGERVFSGTLPAGYCTGIVMFFPISGRRVPQAYLVVLFLTSAGEPCEGGALRILTGRTRSKSRRKAARLWRFHPTYPARLCQWIAGVRDVVVDWFFYADWSVGQR